MIEAMRPVDWPAVCAIYVEGIAGGNATFETEAPSWELWDAKHLDAPRLVFTDPNVLGWAALSRVSPRACYAGVGEVSVYVAVEAQGRGIGSQLLRALVEQSEGSGIWTLQASIFPENEASVQLHLRNGFRIVGRRERIAQLRGVWRDTLLMERRSV
ncbi:MAG TPA: GNAT family N-acetyltransferase [Thermoanaerobaculia bacterium]|nr:GNAT family N-acetyltransferase [Thermoanaerobaculia bacterium]